MPFIGKQPTAGFASIVKDDLTPNGSTTAFTLSKQVANANDIAVFLGNVRQEPTDAYTVSGTTLTMSEAPASGLNFYVLHIAGTHESSVIPADNTISSAKIASNAVTNAKIASNAVTNAKIAGMAASKLTGAMPALDGSALTGLESFTTAELSSLSSAAIVTGLPTDWKIMHVQWYNFRTDGQASIRYRVGGSTITNSECALVYTYAASSSSNNYNTTNGSLYTAGAIFLGNWGDGVGHTGNATILRLDNGSTKTYTMTGINQYVDYNIYGGLGHVQSLYATTGHLDGLEFHTSSGNIDGGLARIFYL